MIPDFEEAIVSFRAFLKQSGVPGEIVWVGPKHTIFCDGREWKIFEGEGVKESEVRSRYQSARGNAFGVQFGLLCADGKFSYCYLYVPANVDDAVSHLLAKVDVKLLVPTEVPTASLVRRRSLRAIWYQIKELRVKMWKSGFFGN